MSACRWPHPGDAPLQRARRVALLYRLALERVAPERCGAIDAQMARWGELWVAPGIEVFEPEDYLTARQAADLASVSVATIRVWRKRGVITGTQLGPRHWLYKASTIYRAGTHVRTRKHRRSA
jgi:hypothetical protein